MLSRFLRDERGISPVVAGRICEALSITLNVPAQLQGDHQAEPEPQPKRRGKV